MKPNDGKTIPSMAGLALLEFSNALSATAVLACAFVSGVQGFVQDTRRCNVINPLIMGLRVAREVANLNNHAVTVCGSSDGKTCHPEGDWNRGWLAFVDQNSDGAMQPVEARRVIARAVHDNAVGKAGIKVLSQRKHFTFEPYRRMGDAAFSGDAFSVCDPRGVEQSRVITVTLRGYAEAAPYRTQSRHETCS